MSKPRHINGAAYRKLWARVRAEGRPCHLCKQPIDYSLPAGHPYCFELDHIKPFSRGGNLYDYDNAGAAHRRCNQRKGNKMTGDGDKALKLIYRTELF